MALENRIELFQGEDAEKPFLLSPANLEYFLAKFTRKYNWSAHNLMIFNSILTNHAYSPDFKFTRSKRNNRKYSIEPFQVNISASTCTECFGFSEKIFYLTMEKMKQVGVIYKKYLKDKHTQKYFVDPGRCDDLYTAWVREDTANAYWPEGVTVLDINTNTLLTESRFIKAKYLDSLNRVTEKKVEDKKLIRAGRKHKVETEKPVEKYDIPYFIEEQ